MAELRQLRGPNIASRDLINGVVHQIIPSLTPNRGPYNLTIIPADPTGSLSGSLLLKHGMMSYTMDLSAGDWYRRMGRLGTFTITPVGLNPAELFTVQLNF